MPATDAPARAPAGPAPGLPRASAADSGHKIADEIDAMRAVSTRDGELSWDRFHRAWWRLVRRVTLGDRTRMDDELTDMLGRLRATANWGFALPQRRGLRESRAATKWEEGVLDPGVTILIHAPFFHRDPSVPGADGFHPELWQDHEAARRWALVPFSSGPGECLGRNPVLLISSLTLARMLTAGLADPASDSPLDHDSRLPMTLSPFQLSFEIRDRPRGGLE